MQKVFLFIIIMMFSFNILYAEPFSISRVQKTAGVPLSEMNYDLPYKDVITDYDYSQLNDKAKVKKANEFLLKLNRKAKYLRNADTDSMNKGYVYFLAFHKYIMESLESIKDEKVKNSPEYHLAYTLGYLAKNGLYEYESILSHVKPLKNMSLAQMKKYIEHKEDDTELVEKIYKLITVLNKYNFSNDNLAVAHLYDILKDNNISDTVLFEYGYLDILNSNQDFFSAISTDGSGGYCSIDVDLKSIDSVILNKFIETFSDTYKSFSDFEKQQNYGESLFYGIISDNTLSMDVMYYFYPFNKNVYVIMPAGTPNNYNIYLLTIDNIEMVDKDNGLDRNLFIENSSSINKISGFTDEELREKSLNSELQMNSEELVKLAPNSPFIKNGKFDDTLFMEYIKEYIDIPAASKFYVSHYKFDINNDGKDELIMYPYFELSRTYKTIGNIFLADEKTLKIKDDNKMGEFLKEISSNIAPLNKGKITALVNKYAKTKIQEADILDAVSDGFKFYLYEYNGMKKIALMSNNIFVDILDNNDKQDININYYQINKSSPKLVWRGKTKNGKPVDLLNLDASFDMSKASTLSEKAIVNDVNLRMLDRLSSDAYFKMLDGYAEDSKQDALNERRQMNREIKNCNGDKRCIYFILYEDVFNFGA